MALDEKTRHALHQRLDEVLGPDHAAALMTAYPPMSWDDVATKQDLRELKLEIEAMFHREISGVNSSINATINATINGMNGAINDRIDGMNGAINSRIDGIHATITAQTRSLVIAVVGAMIANASLTIGALALTR